MTKNVKSSGWAPPQHFKQITANHHRLIKSIINSPITIVNGPPGSLKTYLAVETGIRLIKNRQYEKFLYVRQNIQRPNEKGLGFRPGEEAEKLSPLLKPIEDNLNAIMPPSELEYELRIRRIEGSDMEMLRGRSPLNTVIFADECQNMDLNALKCVMTRLSESSKLILAGDFRGQRDLLGREFDAFELVCRHFSNTSGVNVITLGEHDILRNPLIIDIIRGFESIESKYYPSHYGQADNNSCESTTEGLESF
jgi:phosphate starvation-inducible protein PhoH